jgi:uncharacterized protein (TIGR02270 family)
MFLRGVAVYGANFRLRDIVRLDERVDAHINVLRIAGEPARALYHEALVRGDSGGFSIFMMLSIETAADTLACPSFKSLLATFPNSDAVMAGQPGFCADAVSGLCWLARDPAFRTIREWRRTSEPSLRAIAIASTGARRADPGPALAPTLADHSPLVRARAYRTTGQLGRADLMAELRPGLGDPDPECGFWAAWAAARMGATEPLDTLADIAWNNLPRADRALDLLLRRLDVPQANAWLREFAKFPDRQRSLIRATGVVGDPLYIPWLIERMAEPATARLAGESFSMITGLDFAYRDLDRRPPADFQSGPNDDPADENVALDEDENLPWPDPERIGQWWTANRSRFSAGTPYFLGAPKATADWLEALSDAFQRQRHAAALELAIRQPDKAMFEVRARGRLQRQLLARARGAP